LSFSVVAAGRFAAIKEVGYPLEEGDLFPSSLSPSPSYGEKSYSKHNKML